MSLLLDALKEAEHSKHRTLDPAGAPGKVAPAGEETRQHRPLSLEEELPPVASAPSAPAAAHAPDTRFTDVTRLRVLARPARTSASRLSWLVALLCIVVMLLGGAWFYLTRAIDSAPVPPPASIVSAPAVVSPAPSEHVLPPAQLVPREAQSAAPEIRRELPGSAPVAAAPPPPAEQPIVIVGRSAVSPLATAYAALQAGDLARAGDLYEQVLAADPSQPDAHLGLGVIAQSRQDRAGAITHFRAVLAAVPDQPRAWAGLADLTGDGELSAMESRLRGLLATRPEGSLHFALGNILMRQSRWADAQQEFFAAATAAPANAEYCFNLAIALDRMGKRDAAAAQYRQALRLAEGRPVQFDTAAVRSRIAAISPESP